MAVRLSIATHFRLRSPCEESRRSLTFVLSRGCRTKIVRPPQVPFVIDVVSRTAYAACDRCPHERGVTGGRGAEIMAIGEYAHPEQIKPVGVSARLDRR